MLRDCSVFIEGMGWEYSIRDKDFYVLKRESTLFNRKCTYGTAMHRKKFLTQARFKLVFNCHFSLTQGSNGLI